MFKKPDGGRKKILLFLDTGDNCRCPMAAGYLKKLLAERNIDYIEIKTAGVMTPTGLLPTSEARSLLLEEGVDISRHRSRPLSVQMLEEADLILGMSPLHVQTAFRKSDVARGKTFLLKEYVGYTGKDVQVPDPMGGTMEVFKKSFEQIKDALEKFVNTEFVLTPPPGWQPRPPQEEESEPEESEKRLEPAPAGPAATKASVPAAATKTPATATGTRKTAEEPETAPARKRGRPRKSAEKPETERAASEPAAPRKRGRPRKTAEVSQTAGTPRKPGRPKKTDEVTPKKAAATKKAATVRAATKSAVAKKPGRPKKGEKTGAQRTSGRKQGTDESERGAAASSRPAKRKETRPAASTSSARAASGQQKSVARGATQRATRTGASARKPASTTKKGSSARQLAPKHKSKTSPARTKRGK